ncbi:radical SAM/SPASM domain-containing protein [Pseudobutyrivibrio sp. MD2005]|uniref:radical SAM/SPASM domain-containing protein n=1 Tax=Pseudobutyrivibrio sp. MD2005 TaxID=1410616 RepID=UPI0009DFC98D|nr:radical SAM protein [Pseudobutyrivibrio sp. MD2005]
MDKIRRVLPVDSEDIFKFLLARLREKKLFEDSTVFEWKTDELAALLPKGYLPDTYVEMSLLTGEAVRIASVLNSRECYYINYTTDGEYFTNSIIEPVLKPEQCGMFTGVELTSEGLRSFTGENDFSDSIDLKSHDDLKEINELNSIMERLSEYLVRYRIKREGNVSELTFTTGNSDATHRFSTKKYSKTIKSILNEYGASDEVISGLDSLSVNHSFPFYDKESGYRQIICCIDVAYVRIIWDEGKVKDCRIGIILTDKDQALGRIRMKRVNAYQWHITDECDQRCKHCYLFAEDARLKCVSTSWEQLMHTLDQVTEDSAKHLGYPTLAISGGDPILHPRFWDFAEELHTRGIAWLIMGNPFHLSTEVVKRLRQLGCYKYQMSLDGLEEFHDKLRKPGSFKATIDAVRYFKEAGMYVQFMATASKQNLDDILKCMDVAAECGVQSFTFARYCATSPEKAKEEYPSPEEYRDFLLKYYNKRKEFKKAGIRTEFGLKDHLFTLLQYELGDFEVPEYSKSNPDRICDGCHLGQGVAILANGDIMACRRMESVIGNMKTDNLAMVRESNLAQSYREVKNIKKCKDCELLNWCRGCRAVGYNATGDLQAEDPMCWKK